MSSSFSRKGFGGFVSKVTCLFVFKTFKNNFSDYESSYKQKKDVIHLYFQGLNHLKLQSLAKTELIMLHFIRYLYLIIQDVMRCTLRLPPHVRQCWSQGNRKDHLRIQQCFGGRGGEKSLSFGHLKGMS